MPTLYEKLVHRHRVCDLADGELLLYIDLHIMNEYTSPQAFSGLDAAGRAVRRPERQLGVVDHVNSTRQTGAGSGDAEAALLISNFHANCTRHGIRLIDENHPAQGIEHVVVPDLGLARPGMVIACGDSHTTTYGAFGALGFGIGTSEVEHILATQTLVYRPLRPMRVRIDGVLPPGTGAKDLIMHVIRRLGAGAASGYAVEFAGSAIAALDVAGRMTVCNMAVEMGARAALMAPDERVLAALADRPDGPDGDGLARLRADLADLRSDPDARFAQDHTFRAEDVAPLVTWGTSPDQCVAIDQPVPEPASMTAAGCAAAERALAYMGLRPGQDLRELAVDMCFIGSCTNARIEDLRLAAALCRGRRVAPGVHAIVVPGSRTVRRQAEAEGLADVFRAAGWDWRPESGCSMCLAMNDDVASAGKRLASSTNRNFEGRQGRGARTHLMSPAMVAAAALSGRLCDLRNLARVESPSHA